MSQRVKKPGRPEENQAKRRRRRPTGSDADEDGTRSGSNSGGNGSLNGVWTPRHLNDIKVASIYNRNSAEAPAELYRKDLISAMKLPDSEPLTPEEYWLITDTWKQEWEKGVQVPVNPESLPESQVVVISPVADRSHDFRLPKKKYVRVSHDDFFNPDYHQLVSTAARAEKVCSYDLDDVDAAWLGCANADRVMQTLPVISEFLMEQVVEELELQCWEQVQTILKSQEGLGIEYDENVICDVCRSPESEEGNEMVFCDSCNICVHQACYGITSIPSGSFLCRTCTLGIRPTCILCPNMGGAMKATRSGHKWAHVACAIWIPEVSIGSVEKMEPITKISAIPQSRWSLVCVMCKDKSGACIQCSVKTCKTAYHVTCAFKNGLEMKPIIVDENAEDGIKLRSYCQKHSVNTKKEKTPHSGSEEDVEKKKSRAMTAEERSLARAEKLQQIEAEFFKYVRLKDVSQNLAVDMDIVNLVYSYWKLKRKSLNNRPLVPPRPETTQLLTQQQEQDLEQMKMFVQLRQDLERVRNLCYMVSRREKLSRSFFRLREQTFQKQVAILTDKSIDLNSISAPERAAILEANHGPSIYDQFYSHSSGVKSNYKDFESLVTLIAGDGKRELLNGVVKNRPKPKLNENPYKKKFVNGARRRSESLSSLSEMEISVKNTAAPTVTKAVRKPLAYLFDTDSSMDAVIMSNTTTKRKNLPKKKGPKESGLKQMEKTLNNKSSTSDSELDLPPPIPKPRGKAAAAVKRQPIYSDTESDTATTTKKPVTSIPPVITKGALKEFAGKKAKQKKIPIIKTTSTIRVSPLLQTVGAPSPKKRGRGPGRKKKVDPFGTNIVPQREAAKKASESIRSVKKGKEHGAGQDGGESPGLFSFLKESPPKETPKIKVKEQETLSGDEKIPIQRKSSITESRKSTKVIKKLKPKDEFIPRKEQINSDLDDEAAAAVSIVPQRQAAKKAAEHIRSCQSSVVAARLIIEDEMEASRKKSKMERSGKVTKTTDKSPSRGRPPSLLQTPRDPDPTAKEKTPPIARKVKDKSPVKGGTIPRGNKVGRRASIKSIEKGEPKESDWSFLDKGSQSARRRSRERSSSSSSSSSGSTSSSDSSSSSHSSSSSRSSSPGSVSPICSRPLPTTPSKLVTPISATGPGRKLKTSERSPSSRSRMETSPRAKPTPKSNGPSKSEPRRDPSPSPRTSSSPEQSNRNRASVSPGKRSQKVRTVSSSGSPLRRPVTSPYSPDFTKTLLEEKIERGHGDPIIKEENTLATSSSEQKRTPPKTLIRDELALSSDSEDDVISKKETPVNMRGRSHSRSSVSNISVEMKNRAMPKKKKRELGLLSEDSGGSADEKENSCLSPSPADSPRKAQKLTVPGPISLLLSPLVPSGENKDALVMKASDTEPELKRPRHDSPSHLPIVQNILPQSNPIAAFSLSKSIFSPPEPEGQPKESELLDFDTDLYDLARSVATDYVHEAEEHGGAGGSLAFSFSHDLLEREDNKEESARATMNLVEKLRLQHLRKSGVNQRPSLEGSAEFDDITSDEPQKSPPPPQDGSPIKFQPSFDTIRTNNDEAEENKLCDLSKSPRSVAHSSPDMTKSVPGDERWVPPSNFHSHHQISNLHHQHYMSHPDAESMNNEEEDELNLSHQNLPTVLPPSHPLPSPPLPPPREESILQADFPSPIEVFNRGMSQSHHSHHSLLVESNESRVGMVPLTTSVNLSLPPGICLPPGITASYAGTGGSNFLPLDSPHPSFIPYPLNSSLTNVVTPISTGNLAYFHKQVQLSKSSPQMSVASSHSSPPTSYPLVFSHHFGNMQSTNLTSASGLEGGMHSPVETRRRPSDTNPLAVVTSSMPHLSKPPLTSPSLLLASNNTMTAPPPPPQSTVAQIIESVIQASNNHHNSSVVPNNNMHASNPGISSSSVNMNFHPGISQFQKFMNNSSNPISNPTNSVLNLPINKSPMVSPILKKESPPTQTPIPVSDFSAILSNKTNENILPQKITPTRDYTPPVLPNNNVAVSPRAASGTGRGRRPTTPKVKQEKGVIEEASPKVRGRAERKVSGTSPGRGAKGSTTPRRGAGRGKCKGKNVLVRKDLAGTVYDIDFDEFEENAEDKFDLRSLRDRRKSSDLHSGDYRKSESSGESPIRSDNKQSPRQKINFENEIGVHRQKSGSLGSLPGLEMPSFEAAVLETNVHDGLLGKAGYPNAKDPSTEFATLLMHSISSSATVKDLEELDKTLEALTSPTKISTNTNVAHHSVNNIGLNPRANQLLQNSGLGPGGDSSLSSSKDSFTTTISEDNHSRNQLKFKIKGPFLDANYSSHSISQPTFQQVTHPHHYYPNEPSAMINVTPSLNNPSNLRRMRKKELLRQYCNQDMNMDGKYTNSSLGAEFGMGGPHFHPYGRAVITIPKAVASMAIIPSGKDDYGLDPNDLGPLLTPPPAPVQEKKKRSRGVNREMAALGLLGSPKGERWRDTYSMASSPGSTPSSDTNSRKRVRTATKPSRSTFIPPTLAESGESGRPPPPVTPTKATFFNQVPPTVVTAINHPTPKLKIKFGGDHSSPSCTTTTVTNDINHLDHSDKEAPAKKAKGRPPKKRGIVEIIAPPPPSMEELKRQSLMFREMIMKDFDNDRGSKSSSSRKKKKSKRSKRGMDGETDDSNRSKSPEVKIITDTSSGPKLILRFGKNRTASTASNDSPLNNNNNDGTKKENGPDGPPLLDKVNVGEQDSGFTGSSEGSGSWAPAISFKAKVSTISGLHRLTPNQINYKNYVEKPMPHLRAEVKGIETSSGTSEPSPESGILKFKTMTTDTIAPSTSNSTKTTDSSPTLSKGSNDKVMPIRLKLHRCYEGYATKKEVDRENTNPKPSDSCEVR